MVNQQRYDAWVQTFLLRGATMQQARHMAWVEMGGPQAQRRSINQRVFWWGLGTAFCLFALITSNGSGGVLVAGVPGVACFMMLRRAMDSRKKSMPTQRAASAQHAEPRRSSQIPQHPGYPIKSVRCPRCSTQRRVSAPPGATFRCGMCNALLRVPGASE